MYGLRASIGGHSSDVRCLVSCNYPMNGGFVSGARDKETKASVFTIFENITG